MPDAPPAPARVLGPLSATSIVIGAIIGVGIFFNPSSMAKLTQSGPLLLLAWGIGGLISLCGAMVFAELGGKYNGNGAQYQVLRDAFGPMPAFLYVFCNATAIQAGAIGVIAEVCVQNLFQAIGRVEPTGYLLVGSATFLTAAVACANILGVRWGSSIQNATVILKIIAILVIAIVAALYGKMAINTPPPPESGPRMTPALAVMAALVPAMFAYGGWQHALWISGEVKNPQKNLPRAIIVGVLIVVAVYMLANWSYLKLLGVGAIADSTSVGANAVGAAFPSAGKRIIAGVIAISALGVLNAQLLSGPRLIYGMAIDGRFFPAFSRLSPARGTPVAAIILMSVIAMALIWLAGADGVNKMGTGAVFIDAIFFILTGVALFILRRRGGDWPFKMPGYPVLPIFFILGETGALIGMYTNPKTVNVAWIGVAWIVAAALLYLAKFKRTASSSSISA
jgi:APA family basic amino acid/polyamine antiporter